MLRQFAAAWLVFLLAAAAHQYFARHHPAISLALAVAGLLGAGAGFLKPGSIRWLYLSATVLAFPIGWAVSQLVLALMFYLVLTPIALVLRWRGRDPLRRRLEPDRRTYWQKKSPTTDSRRYLRQY
jgi:Saxitoxin biosynthesis operon protein SxtJ